MNVNEAIEVVKGCAKALNTNDTTGNSAEVFCKFEEESGWRLEIMDSDSTELYSYDADTLEDTLSLALKDLTSRLNSRIAELTEPHSKAVEYMKVTPE